MKTAPARSAIMSSSSPSRIDAFKSAKALASSADIERNTNGFQVTTHYPQGHSLSSVHMNVHSVNQHLKNAFASPKGYARNE